MPPHPTQSHQYAVLELAVQLRRFVQPRDLGEVYVAPLPVRLWSGKVREPDVLFMAKEHADRMAEQYFGPPDLVMEVTSPSTIHTDRAQKAAEYARAGIREYWLIDPNARTVEVLALAGQKYEPAGAWSVGEIARSAVLIGFEVVVRVCFAPAEWAACLRSYPTGRAAGVVMEETSQLRSYAAIPSGCSRNRRPGRQVAAEGAAQIGASVVAAHRLAGAHGGPGVGADAVPRVLCDAGAAPAADGDVDARHDLAGEHVDPAPVADHQLGRRPPGGHVHQ